MSVSAESWLQRAASTLANAGINTARLDCLVLLEDALHHDRAYILAHLEAKIEHKTEMELNKKIIQRIKHAPLAYIRGKAPFYGREFVVNESVLVPRPETETMVSMLKHLPLPARPRIADVGTGSGCLGITVVLEIPAAKVHLYDIDRNALAVARRNARAHDVKARFYEGDLFDQYYFGPYDAVLANLPYVPNRYGINKAARHEPEIALFAGEDGLDIYRRFWQQLGALDEKPPFVLTEALPPQHDTLAALAKAAGYRLNTTDELIQQFTPTSS